MLVRFSYSRMLRRVTEIEIFNIESRIQKLYTDKKQ